MSGGKMVNINREIDDQFYRYKMPLVMAKVQGHGNGIHTAIPNMDMVAKSLDRMPSYVTKYFGVELGSVTQIVDKDNKYIVNGRHEEGTMQDLLDGFIKKFVLCKECGNPETKLRVTSKKLIEQNCIACGYRTHLPQIHRLCKYIINNPPNDVKSKTSKSTKEERKKARNKKAGGKDKGDDKADSAPTASDSIDVAAGGSRSNANMRAEGGTVDVPDAVDDDGDEDEEWSLDMSDEAVRARTETELGIGAKGLVGSSDLDKSMNDRLELFLTYVEERKDLAKFPAKEIIGEAERLDCKDKGVTCLVQLLWANDDPMAAMKTHQGIFQRFTFENPKAQKYTLQAFEKLMELRPELMPKVVHLLKQMYDLDLIDEESFLEWDKKINKAKGGTIPAQIQAKAKAFFGWLKEADEEESSDDETIGFEAAPTPVAASKAPAAKAAVNADEEEDDDLDIDDI